QINRYGRAGIILARRLHRRRHAVDQLPVGRTQVGAARARRVVALPGGRRAAVEIRRRRESLRDNRRADRPAVALEQLAVRLVAHQHLRQARDDQRVDDPEQDRGHDRHQQCCLEMLFHDASLNVVMTTSIILIPMKGAISPPTPEISMLRRRSASALMARYDTPRSASGTSATMISALKMTAERIADSGVF